MKDGSRADAVPRSAGAGTSLNQAFSDLLRRSNQPARERRPGADSSRLESTVGMETLHAYDQALESLQTREREAVICRVELRQNWDQLALVLGDSTTEEARQLTCDALLHMGEEMCGVRRSSPRAKVLAEAIADRSPIEWDTEILSAEE